MLCCCRGVAKQQWPYRSLWRHWSGGHKTVRVGCERTVNPVIALPFSTYKIEGEDMIVHVGIDCETIGLGAAYGIALWDDNNEHFYYQGVIDPHKETVHWHPRQIELMNRFIRGKTHVTHNGLMFDGPKLRAIGIEVSEECEDTMLASHTCDASSPRGLKEQRMLRLKEYESEKKELIEQTRECRRILQACRSSIEKMRISPKLTRMGFRDWDMIDYLSKVRLPDGDIEASYWLNAVLFKRDVKGQVYALEDANSCRRLWVGDQRVGFPGFSNILALNVSPNGRPWMDSYQERKRECPAFLSMEATGMRILPDKASELFRGLDAESEKTRRKFLSVFNADVNSRDQVETLLFDTIGCQSVKMTPSKTNPRRSVDEEVRVKLMRSVKGELQKLIVEALDKRAKVEQSKKQIRGYLENQRNWRLYYGFNPTGTDTLRPSSSNINILNVGKKEGYNLRPAFGCEDGWALYLMDLSNAELRYFAWHAQEEKMLQWFKEGRDVHAWTGQTVLRVAKTEFNHYIGIIREGFGYIERHQLDPSFRTRADQAVEFYKGKDEAISQLMMSVKAVDSPQEVTTRFAGKQLNFLSIYGGGPAKAGSLIAQLMKLEFPDNTLIPRLYHETFPGVKRFWSEVMLEINETGRVYTAHGYPLVPPPEKRYAGIDYICQGGVAQQTNRAMVACHRYIKRGRLPIRMLYNKYDELAYEVRCDVADKHIERLREFLQYNGLPGLETPCEVTVHAITWADRSCKIYFPKGETDGVAV